MDCPLDGAPLTRVDVEAGAPGLAGFACGKCTGHWLRFGDYLAWRDRQTGEVPEVPGEMAAETVEPSGGPARRCPDCGHLLTRYRVGRGVSFALDRCGNCSGVRPGFRRMDDTPRTRVARQRAPDVRTGLAFRRADGGAPPSGRGAVRATAGCRLRAGAREFAEWVAAHPRRSEIMAYVQSRIR